MFNCPLGNLPRKGYSAPGRGFQEWLWIRLTVSNYPRVTQVANLPAPQKMHQLTTSYWVLKYLPSSNLLFCVSQWLHRGRRDLAGRAQCAKQRQWNPWHVVRVLGVSGGPWGPYGQIPGSSENDGKMIGKPWKPPRCHTFYHFSHVLTSLSHQTLQADNDSRKKNGFYIIKFS